MPAVVRSLEIQALPSVVWRWLATPEALRRWLSPNLEIDLRVGGAYRCARPGTTRGSAARVLELVPEGELVLSWLEEGGDWVHPARLVFTWRPRPRHDRDARARRLRGHRQAGWPDTLQAYERGADRHQLLQRLAAWWPPSMPSMPPSATTSSSARWPTRRAGASSTCWPNAAR